MTNMRITLGNMQQNVQQKLDNMQQKLDNMQQKLDDMQQDVGTLREEVTFTNAIAYNHGVISRNVRNMPGSDVQALKKTARSPPFSDLRWNNSSYSRYLAMIWLIVLSNTFTSQRFVALA